ncbi:hypothetical protein DVK44_18525 [Streptomyces paludis]|uniref:Uncharacterized protein n=1 Tax=Streptomyces paludis TaxID=2282738 RepID=A0A345HRJ5_9ACTN|nr:hypothetical protein DVK44_18525 [Streptomyces paludis]
MVRLRLVRGRGAGGVHISVATAAHQSVNVIGAPASRHSFLTRARARASHLSLPLRGWRPNSRNFEYSWRAVKGSSDSAGDAGSGVTSQRYTRMAPGFAFVSAALLV